MTVGGRQSVVLALAIAAGGCGGDGGGAEAEAEAEAESESEAESEAAAEVTPLSSVPIPGGATDVLLRGATAWALGVDDLLTLDVSDPAAPATTANAGWGGLGLARVGDTLFVATGMTLIEADISGGVPETVVEYTFGPRAANRVSTADPRAYIASDNDMVVLDMDRDPPLLGSVGIGGAVNDIVADDRLVYAAASERGLMVVDITDYPPEPTFYQIETLGWALAVFPIGEARVLVGAAREIAPFDLSDETRPERLSRTFVEARVFSVDGERVFAIGEPCGGGAAAGLRRFDIADMKQVACDAMPGDVTPDVRTAPAHGRGFAVGDGFFAVARDANLDFYSLP